MAGKGGGGGKKKEINSSFRQEPNGKKLNAKTMCKLDHLKNIAEWAALESCITPLAAFFGHRVAATNQALGLRNDPSSFLCERCETILQPGNNCTVRIEKNKSKRRNRRKKKANNNHINTQNCVVYSCHFCEHRNSMRGTVKGYVKEICPPKVKPQKMKTKPTKAVVEEEVIGVSGITAVEDVSESGAVVLPIVDGKDVETCMPATPVLLLDANRRKRNRPSAKKAGTEISSSVGEDKGVQSSSKRRKKAWTSLKQIVESKENDTVNKLSSLTVPFFI